MIAKLLGLSREISSPAAALLVPTVPFVYLCLLFPGPAQMNEIIEACVCVLRCWIIWTVPGCDSCDIPECSGGFWELGRTNLGLWIGMALMNGRKALTMTCKSDGLLGSAGRGNVWWSKGIFVQAGTRPVWVFRADCLNECVCVSDSVCGHI